MDGECRCCEMRVGVRSDVGRMRSSNQDVGFVDVHIGLFAVADGMGGHNGGEIASRMAIDTLTDHNWDLVQTPGDLQLALAKANAAIWDTANSNRTLKGMGTTMTMAKVVSQTVLIGHVGDSRAYLIHSDGTGQQLTDDHSVVGQLVRDGCLTEGEARVHPQRNLLTNALGTQPQVVADVFAVEPEVDDVILLCSDGLINEVAPGEVSRIIGRSAELQQSVDYLVDLANQRGGRDNITVIAFSLGKQ